MTDSAALETAWQRFVTADVPVATVLALEDAAVDNQELTRLQQQMFAGGPADKAAAATELRELLADARCALTLDALIAAGFDGADQYADALAIRVEALAVAARWHPIEAPRLIGNIGFDLLKLGHLDEAKSWYQRALTWDPANPFAILGLAEVHLARGELPAAFYYRDHLAAERYPAAHTKDFDDDFARLGVTRPPSAGGYRPDLSRMVSLDDVGFARLVTTLQFDRNAVAKESLRAHALACLMHRRADYAYWTASLSAAAAWTGVAERGELEQPWSQVVLRAMTAALSPDVAAEVAAGAVFGPADRPHDQPEAAERRLAAFAALAGKGDHVALSAALHDPHPGLRLAAASALVDAGAGELCATFLAEAAAYEQHRGYSTWRPEMAPTASRIVWRDERRRALATRPTLVIPEDGIENPSLAAIEPGQLLSVMLTFVDPLSDAHLARLQQAVGAVLERVDWSTFGGEPRLAIERDDHSLHLALIKPATERRRRPAPAADLRPLVRDLLAAVSSAVPFTEVMLARLALPDEDGHLLQPIDDPRDTGTYDHDEIWAPSFDPAAAPPASEPEGGLFIMLPSGDGHVPERRNARLWLRDLRIVYGLAEIDELPADARSAQVAAALTTALDHTFRGLPPPFRHHGAAGAVGAITRDGRRGHAFAIEGMNPRFLVHYPGTSRFREYELFQAVRETAAAVGLRPLVHWYREGGLYVLNLWDW